MQHYAMLKYAQLLRRYCVANTIFQGLSSASKLTDTAQPLLKVKFCSSAKMG